MNRWLITIVLATAGLSAVGCRPGGGGGTPDGSNPDSGVRDLGQTQDLSAPDLTAPPPPDFSGLDLTGVDLTMVDQAAPVDMAVSPQDQSLPPADLAGAIRTTINEIDTGVVPSGGTQQYFVEDVIVIGVGRRRSTTPGGTGGTRCDYDAYVQDPAGNAPSGINLYQATGCVQPDGGACTCPTPNNSGTLLGNLQLGDKLTVVGRLSAQSFPIPDGGGQQGQAQHQFVVTGINKTGTGTVNPVVITDGSIFGKYASGFVTYESMLVTIRPPQPGTVSGTDNFGNFFFGGGAYASIYSFIYKSGLDGGITALFPTDGSTWTSITGIAQPNFGGGISPRIAADFVP